MLSCLIAVRSWLSIAGLRTSLPGTVCVAAVTNVAAGLHPRIAVCRGGSGRAGPGPGYAVHARQNADAASWPAPWNRTIRAIALIV